MAFIMLTVTVLIALLYPIRKRPIDFDEKSEAIRIYRDEVTHIEQQFDKELIDDVAKQQLLEELDKKSATAMLSIEQKSFAYRGAYVSAVLIFVGLAVGGFVYANMYHEQGIDKWHAQGKATHDNVIAGLFDSASAHDFIAQQPQTQAQIYCFLMQHEMLTNYADNPDALAHVAQCHSALGFVDLARGAIERALYISPEHVGANYAEAELEMLYQYRLSLPTENALVDIYQQQPNEVDIAYLLLVNSYSKGAFDKASHYAKRLREYAGDNEPLMRAVSDFENQMQVSRTLSKTTKPEAQTETPAATSPHNAPMKTDTPALTSEQTVE